MSDLAGAALAERLHAFGFSDNGAELAAREALAFVAALLPTRETWGRVLYHLDCPDGDPVECPHWESELYAEEREDFMRKADALLRELRGRLGVKG